MEHKTIRYHFVAMAILLTLFFITSNFANHLATPTRYTIDKTAAVYTTYAYRIDPTKALTLQQLLASPDALIKQPLSDIHWDLKAQNYWLVVNLKNKQSSPVQMYVHFDNPMADHLSVYRLDENQNLLESIKLGDKTPNLTLFQYSVPHIALTLNANQTQQLIIKVDTVGISKTPINIYGNKEFKDLIRSQAAIWGIFVGVLLMAALYNMVLYFGIRDRVYLVYIGYILSALLLMGSVLGFGFYIWPLSWQLFFNHHVVVSNYVIAFFTVAFCTMFLRYHKDKCRLYKTSIAFLWLLAILGVSSYFIVEYTASKVFFVVMVFIYILCFSMIYKKLMSGFRWTKFYIISWVPLIIGAAVQPLELTGFIAYSFATRHLFLVAILCEIVLMAMALADRVRYQREKALYHATHTQQTKLLNQAMLKQAYMALNSQQRSATLCLIKIRYFNSLTSILSPQQGSNIVTTVATALEQSLFQHRQFANLDVSLDNSPKVADLSGGVVAFISTKIQPAQSIYELLASMTKLLPKHYVVAGLDLQLEYNLSVAPPIDNDAFDAWLQRGYMHLNQERNPVESSNTMTVSLTLAVALQNAIRTNQLVIYLQPLIDLKTGNITGAEALLRWPDTNHPIDIEELINLAEQTGIINELTLWVIDQTCSALQKLAKQGYPNHSISVNLSPKNLTIPNFIEKIENSLLKYNVSVAQLQFELTESALIEQQGEMRLFISQLEKLGINVVLDDFGTGYSSLSYLLNYSFSTLKVDKSFIADLSTSENNQVIVKTAIEMAHNLGMSTTVEGVKDEPTAALLKQLGADKAQGYYYTEALPFDEYIVWLAARDK